MLLQYREKFFYFQTALSAHIYDSLCHDISDPKTKNKNKKKRSVQMFFVIDKLLRKIEQKKQCQPNAV